MEKNCVNYHQWGLCKIQQQLMFAGLCTSSTSIFAISSNCCGALTLLLKQTKSFNIDDDEQDENELVDSDDVISEEIENLIQMMINLKMKQDQLNQSL